MKVIDAIDGGADIRLYVTVSTDEIRYYHINGRGTNSFGDYINFTHSNPIEVDMITISRNERNGTVGRLISPLVDNLLFDKSTGMLYMIGNGRIISSGVRIAEGEGNNAVLTIENTTGWSSKTIPNYADCMISFVWSSVDGEVSTGSGTVIVKVDGELQHSEKVKQGECSLNINNYLNIGENLIHVTIIDIYGNSQTIPFGVTMFDPSALKSTKLVERTLTGDYINDRVTKVGQYAFHGLTLNQLSLPNVTEVGRYAFMTMVADEVDIPLLTSIERSDWMIRGATIGVVKLPSVTAIDTDSLWDTREVGRIVFNSLETIGVSLKNGNNIKIYDFHALTSLRSLPHHGRQYSIIIRTPTVCTLQDAPISQVLSQVSLYVPRDLVDSYKVATNWSTYANQIRAIEDYTVDGTTTGELDESKL
jgi:hypothetical protein